MEPSVTVFLRIPTELYKKWSRRSDDSDDTFEAAVIHCLQRHQLPRKTAAQPDSVRADLFPASPAAPGSDWRQAWSRRWGDLLTPAQSTAFDPNDPST